MDGKVLKREGKGFKLLIGRGGAGLCGGVISGGILSCQAAGWGGGSSLAKCNIKRCLFGCSKVRQPATQPATERRRRRRSASIY